MELTERELAKMNVEELKKLCNTLQTQLSTVEWFLRQKQIAEVKFPKKD